VTTPAVVELESVNLHYAKNWALRDVTASFPAGAVGLLGPNGAGKSTLIKAVLGLVAPDRERMSVLGHDVKRSPLHIRSRIGYMPESDAHFPHMNAVSFVAYCGELSGLPRADAMQRAHEVLYYVGLGEARYRMIDQYSTGMALGRLQAGQHPEFAAFLNSVQLSGDGKTVSLSFSVPAEMIDALGALRAERFRRRSLPAPGPDAPPAL